MTNDTIQQPKIAGYRQLTEADAALMNEAKALGVQMGAFVEKLRALPRSPDSGVVVNDAGVSSIDQRWVSIGATDLQRGLMSLIRGIAQPTTF